MRNIDRIAVGIVDQAIRIEAATDPNPATGANSKYDFWFYAYGQWQRSTGSSIKFHETPPAKAGHIPAPAESRAPGNEEGPNGVTHEALLEVVLDRLRAFQKGKCSCRENAIAITHLETALLFLQQRTRDRMRRGVEGQVNVP